MIIKLDFESRYRYMGLGVKQLVLGHQGVFKIHLKNDTDYFAGGKLNLEHVIPLKGARGVPGQSFGSQPKEKIEIPPMKRNKKNHFRIKCEFIPEEKGTSDPVRLTVVLYDEENNRVESKNFYFTLISPEDLRKEKQNSTVFILVILTFVMTVIVFFVDKLIPFVNKLISYLRPLITSLIKNLAN
jgi:hypothetical protein